MPIPEDAVPLSGPSIPDDAVPLSGTGIPEDAVPLTDGPIPNDAVPIDPSNMDATPVQANATGAPQQQQGNSIFGNLLRGLSAAIFGNDVNNATPLGPVIMTDGGDFYKDPSGQLRAFSTNDFIAPDPKTGALMAFSHNQPGGVYDKLAAVANAVTPGFGVEAPPGAIASAFGKANQIGTAAKEAETGASGAAPAAGAAPAGAEGAAAGTAASGAATGSPELQARINGLMAGDRVIMTPQQLELLQTTSGAETKGAAAALDSSATEPIVKEGLSREIVGAFRDMLEAGNVTMVPGIKPTDQVLALMRSDILPAETYRQILQKWGVDPVEVVQSALGEGMRASAAKAGQTLQQLSDLQRVIASKLSDTPEANAFLKSQTDDIGNAIRSNAGKLRGLYMSSLVGQLATSMRNALVATATGGVDTLSRLMDQGLRTLLVNPVRQIRGLTPLDDPINAFANWQMLLRSAGRVARGAVGATQTGISPYAITKAITDALPDARASIFGRYASDVSRATGGTGILSKLQQANDFLNFHGRFQEFVFRRAFFAAELTRRLEARGLNLDDIIRNNQIARIPDEDIHGAVNEALRLTYGRPLGNSAFDNAVRGFNQFQTLGGVNPIPPVPFVRFMADAMKWQFEHSPLGAVRLLSSTERAALGAGGSLQVASRALMGSAMLYGAYLLRQSGYGGPEWFSLRVPGTNTNVDLRPFNPITNFLFAADMIKRAQDGTLAGLDAKQMAQGLIGANFRAGVGLYLVDDLISKLAGNEGAASKIKDIAETWAGDTLAGFVTPFEMLRDVVAQVNPNERIVRDQSQSPLTAPAQSRIPYLSQSLPPLASPTRAGPIEEQAPIIKQLLGVTVQEDKNAAEKELARLGIQRKEVMPPSGDPATDRAMATLMGPLVEKVVGKFVQTPQYQSMDNTTKAYLVSQIISDIRGAATKGLPPDLAIKEQFAKKGMRERIFLENMFNNLPPDRRNLIINLLVR